MPITQQRMMAVINAGIDYKNALELLILNVKDLKQAVDDGQRSPENVLAQLVGLADSNKLLKFPAESPAVIFTERKHFQHAQGRNIRMMKQQRKKRGKPPIEVEDFERPNDMLHIRDPRVPMGPPRPSITDKPELSDDVEVLTSAQIAKAVQEHGTKSVAQLKQEIEELRGALPPAIRHPEDQEEDLDQSEELKLDIAPAGKEGQEP